MKRKLSIARRDWPLHEPFATSTSVQTAARVVIVRLAQGQEIGLGESKGVSYHGETQASMIDQIESVRTAIEDGAGRQDLLSLLPAGGARAALDAALWDLEAGLSGTPAWKLAGLSHAGPLVTAVTIGLRSAQACARSAHQLRDYPWIKLKVDAQAPLEAVSAVRQAAPAARLIVDANQAWTLEQLVALAPAMAALKVDLLEQPIAAGADAGLIDYRCPVTLCADESLQTDAELGYVAGRYDMVNLKLDKCGGLTAALALADAAQQAGLQLMVGCMVSASVAMAPAMILGQRCTVCDLDGPLLLSQDWEGGIRYDHGLMPPPWPALWG